MKENTGTYAVRRSGKYDPMCVINIVLQLAPEKHNNMRLSQLGIVRANLRQAQTQNPHIHWTYHIAAIDGGESNELQVING